MTAYNGPHFGGETYCAELDHARLSSQLNRVLAVMVDWEWHTLAELSRRCGGSVASVSARLRDLRKAKFGGWRVERDRGDAPGVFVYQLRLPEQ